MDWIYLRSLVLKEHRQSDANNDDVDDYWTKVNIDGDENDDGGGVLFTSNSAVGYLSVFSNTILLESTTIRYKLYSLYTSEGCFTNIRTRPDFYKLDYTRRARWPLRTYWNKVHDADGSDVKYGRSDG